MRFDFVARSALAIVAGAALASCYDAPTAMRSIRGSANLDEAPAATHVVISQVYGAGGNSGATYKNDFVELYNPGTTAVSLVGWSVQYASATGTGNFASNAVTALSGAIEPGKYYLVSLSGGSTGASLPQFDASGTVNLSGSSGKVALVDLSTGLTCNGSSAQPCSADDLAHIVDLIGYGSANFFEGDAAPGLSSTTAAIRKNGGKQDTDDNSVDFVAGAPNPRNSGAVRVVGPLDHIAISGATSVSNEPVTLTATLEDAGDLTIADADAIYSWSTSDPSAIEVLSQTGNTAVIKGHTVGNSATITVTGTSNRTTKSGSVRFFVAPAAVGHVTIGSGTSPLVVGYQTQLFVNGGSTDQGGTAVTSGEVTWTSSDPGILTVDNRGVVTAVDSGSAMLIGTAPDGSAGWFVLSTEVPFYRTDERAGHNTELGTPTDADPSNDVIIAREQYTISYNPRRGGPNWVSWDLSSTHLGSRDRCNCYSADTALVRLGYGQYMYNTADYTGGGYDRGHMEPSADQTRTDGENARTFFLTNFLPQQHALNAGPWEDLEIAVRDSVKAGREAYVIAGGVFTRGVGLGSLKGEGKIYIPDSTWKIVVLMPANEGLSDVTSPSDIDVIAVNMPNVATGLSDDWTVYRTSVQAIQRSTGYDFLSALPQAIQDAVENHTPVVNALPDDTILTGEAYPDAITFVDADRDPWTAAVDYGDGQSQDLTLIGRTFTLNHSYAAAGAFTLSVTVSDGRATSASESAVVTVQSPEQGITNLDDALAALSDGSLGGGLFAAATTTSTSPAPALSAGELESLRAKLTAASSQLTAGKKTPAANTIGAFVNELQAIVRSGRLSPAKGQPIITYAQRVAASIRKS